MRTVVYEVTTPKGNTKTKSLARAQEIVTEKGGSYKATVVNEPAKPLTDKDREMIARRQKAIREGFKVR